MSFQNTIFQAELAGLIAAMNWFASSTYDFAKIFVDSLSVIEACSKFTTDNSLICHILDSYQHVINTNKDLTIVWVPSHEDLFVNELADYAAKIGSEHGCSISLPTPKSSTKKLLFRFFEFKWYIDWENQLYLKSEIVRCSFPHYQNLKIFSRALFLNLLDYRLINLLTGHNRLNHFLFKIGTLLSPACRCGFDDESCVHFIYDCELHSAYRDILISSLRSRFSISWSVPLVFLFHL